MNDIRLSFDDIPALIAALNRLTAAVEAVARPAAPPDTRTNPPLTDLDVSKRLGVSAFTVRSWRVKGIGPRYFKVGRAVRYRLADVETYEQKNRHA
jgi:hypothetical protein